MRHAGEVARREQLCAAYLRAKASGEDLSALVGRFAAEFGVQRPAIWKALRRGGAVAEYEKRGPGGRGRPIGGGVGGYTAQRREKALSLAGERAAALPIAVDRFPCPRCGVRSDVGCAHIRAAAL